MPREWSGVALVIAACALWAIDNNVTLQISVRDARQIVALKGLIGGCASLLLAAATRSLGQWSVATALEVLLVGCLSFGVSLVLYVRGLRMLGVLQTGVLFALAPGMAAVLSWLVLGEPVRLPALLALAFMTAGALLLAADRHLHLHVHEPLEHSHAHEHDVHHQHEHTPEQLAAVPHAHRHRHEPQTHSHPHAHDVHHRHGH